MDDRTFLEAIERRYLAQFPDHADLLALFGPEDRAQYLRRWLGTFQAHRLMLAWQFEGAGFADLAAWLRDHPLGTW